MKIIYKLKKYFQTCSKKYIKSTIKIKYFYNYSIIFIFKRLNLKVININQKNLKNHFYLKIIFI